jgi:SAM-dependent methyltransferase
MSTLYDEVPYPSHPFRQTHPARLGAALALYGLPYAPVETARVLEIGCGEAGNILPLAASYPAAQVVGFDLAATAIAEGRRVAERLGLRNIRLEALDILDAGSDLGQFDYIISHGVYSWTPEPVRDGLMACIKACLAPGGVAFVSYNAMPGCHMRMLLREMLLHHLRDREGFQARLEAAREFLTVYIEQAPEQNPAVPAIKQYCRAMLQRDPRVLFHDELGPVFEPFYVHQVLEHARTHGLAFLAESEGVWWREELFPSSRGKAIARLAGDDPLDLHQYQDFLTARLFRQTLLTHAELKVERSVPFRRIRSLYVEAEIKPPADANFASPGMVRFELGDGAAIGLEEPHLKQSLAAIGEAWPQAVAIADLPDHPDVEEGLLQLFAGGHVDLSTAPSPFQVRPGEKPLASPIARLQAAEGAGPLTSLDHGLVVLEDPHARALLRALDGTRDREDLVVWMRSEGGVPDASAASVDQALATLGRLALLAG